jgi:hypothetical protein
MSDGAQILVERLEEAFGYLAVPAPEASVYDSSGDHLECVEVAEFLGSRHWRELGFDELLRQREALSFLSPEGYRFYLPAFLRSSLLDFEAADLIPMFIVWSLGRTDNHIKWQCSLLDAEQRRVVADCVAFIAEQAPDDFTPEEIECAIAHLTHVTQNELDEDTGGSDDGADHQGG